VIFTPELRQSRCYIRNDDSKAPKIWNDPFYLKFKSAYPNLLRSNFLGREWPSLRLYEPPLSQFWERGSEALNWYGLYNTIKDRIGWNTTDPFSQNWEKGGEWNEVE
jgi:hypothetical protein